MSKLSEASVALARARPRAFEPKLSHMPPPMTANRANDFHECKRCQNPCGYCDELHPINDD